jgi:hypothetical protein
MGARRVVGVRRVAADGFGFSSAISDAMSSAVCSLRWRVPADRLVVPKTPVI